MWDAFPSTVESLSQPNFFLVSRQELEGARLLLDSRVLDQRGNEM